MAELGARAQTRLNVRPAWLHQEARQGANPLKAGLLSEHPVARLAGAASRPLPPFVAGIPSVLTRSHVLI